MVVVYSRRPLMCQLIFDFDTWQLRSFGFAGTKDKRAVTTQRVRPFFVMSLIIIPFFFILVLVMVNTNQLIL